MKKIITYLFVPLIGFALMGVSILDGNRHNAVMLNLNLNAQNPVSPTLEPTQIQESASETITPADRVLPPIGGNAGLVLGASVLVLIIIAGVGLVSRRRSKH